MNKYLKVLLEIIISLIVLYGIDYTYIAMRKEPFKRGLDSLYLENPEYMEKYMPSHLYHENPDADKQGTPKYINTININNKKLSKLDENDIIEEMWVKNNDEIDECYTKCENNPDCLAIEFTPKKCRLSTIRRFEDHLVQESMSEYKQNSDGKWAGRDLIPSEGHSTVALFNKAW